MVLTLKVLVVVSLLIFIVGMIKPKWILFFMKNPDRLTVTMLAMLLFMASWTGIAKLTLKPRDRASEQRTTEPVDRDEANRFPLTR